MEELNPSAFVSRRSPARAKMVQNGIRVALSRSTPQAGQRCIPERSHQLAPPSNARPARPNTIFKMTKPILNAT